MHFLTLQTPAALNAHVLSDHNTFAPCSGSRVFQTSEGFESNAPEIWAADSSSPHPLTWPCFGEALGISCFSLPRLTEGAWAAIAQVVLAIWFHISGSHLTQGSILETIRDVLLEGWGGKEDLSFPPPQDFRTDWSQLQPLCHCTLLYHWVAAPSLPQSGTPASLG